MQARLLRTKIGKILKDAFARETRGIGKEKSASRARSGGSFSPKTELDFSLRPILHLGAYAQLVIVDSKQIGTAGEL